MMKIQTIIIAQWNLQDNSEVYGGVKPEEQLVVAQERVNNIFAPISFEEIRLEWDEELLNFDLYL